MTEWVVEARVDQEERHGAPDQWSSPMNRLAAGAVSGVLGTAALNATTYADLAVRGRAPSTVPAQTVERMEEAVGADLGERRGDEVAQHRREGLGALFGYLTGMSAGAVYGLARSRLPRIPLPLASLGVGLGAMVAADAGAVLAGVTDPRRWGVSGWLADLVPHAIFGLATATSFERLAAASD